MIAATKRTARLVVLGSTLALMVSNGPILLYTFGVFLKPVSEQYGWSRGTMSLGLTAGLILGGLATPFVGYLIDRWSIQRVTLIIVSLFAASFALIALTPGNVIVFIGLYALAGLLASGQAPLPYAKSISGWFEQSRGLALGIAMAGVGIGIAVMPQVARLLLNAFGWRTAYALVGAITWLVAFPAVLLCVKDPVRDRSVTASARVNLQVGEEVRIALAGRSFWLIAIASFLVVTAVNGITAHLIALLTDKGVPSGLAASLLACVGLATIVGRLLSGYLLDRTFAPYLAAVIFLLPLIGIAVLMAGSTVPAFLLLAAVSLGLGLGAEVDIIGFLIGRYFGLRRYGELYGYVFAAFTVGSGVGPLMMGASFDRAGGYGPCLVIFAAALLVASVLIAMLGAYAYPAQPDLAAGRATEASLLEANS